MRRWGSVYYDRHAGGWRVRAGDERRTSLGLYPTEAEAEQVRAEAERAWVLASRTDADASSLAVYGERWVEREQRRGIRRGMDEEAARFRRHLASAPFAAWPLAAVTRADVQRWALDLLSEPAEGPRGHGQRRGRETVLRAVSLLRVICTDAVTDGVIEASPAQGVTLPREERTAEDFEILSPAEVDLLRTTDRIPIRSHAAFLAAVFTGCRAGELWGLLWEDVRLGGQAHLVVRHSRARGTKGGRVRRVPLLEPAREILARWQAECSRKGRAPRGLVWPARGGKHHAKGYDAGWQDAAAGRPGREYTRLGYRWRAGIDTRIPIKDLRHTCASHLLRGTWVPHGWVDRPLRMEELQQWLGHQSITTTERYYARLAPGGLLDVVPAVRHLRAVEDER